MTWTVYGLRLKGDREVRYVGVTRHTPEKRLFGHHGEWGCSQRPFPVWLRANKGNIETFAIAKVDTIEEARSHERAIIALCSRLRQRLFNRYGVEPEFRLPTKSQGIRCAEAVAEVARAFA